MLDGPFECALANTVCSVSAPITSCLRCLLIRQVSDLFQVFDVDWIIIVSNNKCWYAYMMLMCGFSWQLLVHYVNILRN